MPLPPLPMRAQARTESLALKSFLVISALMLGSLVVVAQEFFFSAPAFSLSETEAALRLAAR
ncbi:MAG: hypothetical protein JO237_10000 [Pseudolabrys sp.]|nr:hypothetical protein [Pseudolabrys sp.]